MCRIARADHRIQPHARGPVQNIEGARLGIEDLDLHGTFEQPVSQLALFALSGLANVS